MKKLSLVSILLLAAFFNTVIAGPDDSMILEAQKIQEDISKLNAVIDSLKIDLETSNRILSEKVSALKALNHGESESLVQSKKSDKEASSIKPKRKKSQKEIDFENRIRRKKRVPKTFRLETNVRVQNQND